MSYTIYLDKDEMFECEASIKNASYKNSSARLIVESDDLNLVFFGEVNKNNINVPIKSLKKYFNEKDTAKIKLEVIVENTLLTPWQSEVTFDTFNKVQIAEVKNTKQEPLVEVTVNKDKLNVKKERLLGLVNEQIKKLDPENKLTKAQRKELIKKLIK